MSYLCEKCRNDTQKYGGKFRGHFNIKMLSYYYRNSHYKDKMVSCRIHFVYAPSQWEATLQCNVISHWLGAYTDQSLCMTVLSLWWKSHTGAWKDSLYIETRPRWLLWIFHPPSVTETHYQDWRNSLDRTMVKDNHLFPIWTCTNGFWRELFTQSMELTHWDVNKEDHILPKTISNAFSGMKMFWVWIKFHWNILKFWLRLVIIWISVDIDLWEHMASPGNQCN